MSQISVRRAVPDDLDALAALFVELDAHHTRLRPDEFLQLDGPARPPAMIMAFMHDGDGVVFVAQDQLSGSIVGLAHVYKRVFPPSVVAPGRVIGELDSLVVFANSRRRGVATRLVEEAGRWSDEQGFGALELNVREFNGSALAFYQALGFMTVSRRLRRPRPPLSAQPKPVR
jgi:ribosomal protein S18 acetylase RimI-like enzyme